MSSFHRVEHHRSSRSRWRIVAFATALALLVASCGSSAPSSTSGTTTAAGTATATAEPVEQNPAKVKFGIGGAGSFAFVTAYVALNQGYMAEELKKLNVEVEAVDLPGSVDGIRAVDTGTVDYAATVTSTMILAVSQGASLQQILTYLDSDLVLMTARPGLNVKDPKDLVVNRTWGIPSIGSSGQVTALKVLKNWGYTDKDVNWVVMGNVQAAAAAVEAKRADVYWLGVAPAEQFLENGTLQLAMDFYDLNVVKSVYSGPYMTAGIIGNPKFMSSHTKLTKAIVTANLRALKFIQDNKSDTEAIRKALPTSMHLSYVTPVLKRILPGFSKDGMVSLQAMETVFAAAKAGGLVKADVQLDLSKLLSNAYR